MGLAPTPSQKDHFSKDPMFGNEWIRSRISYRLWADIHNALKFDIDWVENAINLKFRYFWTPFHHVSIDEGIIPFKGRYKYRQHVRGKPHATGIKFYALCDEDGYIWWFWTYKGSQPSTSLIVSKFTAMLPNWGYHVYVDSYYGTESLAQKLQKQHHKFTMTCQANRPSWLFSRHLQEKLQKGKWHSIYNEEKDMTALSFSDNAKCNFISNIYDGQATVIDHRGKIIPALVHDYRQYYGCVDRMDASHIKYLFPHRRKKRSVAQLLSYFKMATTNAWRIYRFNNDKEIGQKDFIRALLGQISPNSSKISNFPTSHLIVRASVSRNCTYCLSQFNKHSNTPYQCDTCSKYCHPDCFKKFHSNKS
jgi:hypothetical protein